MKVDMVRHVLLMAVCLWGLARAGPAFLQIEGIPGESVTLGHEAWIEVDAFSNRLALKPAEPTPGQAPALGVPASEVSFMKRTDKSSPKLAQALCLGEVLPRARFEFVRSDARATRFYVIELEQVSVIEFSTAGGGEERPVEQVRLGFSQASWSYTEFASSGQPVADHELYWDFLRQEGGSSVRPLGFTARAVVRTDGVLSIRWVPEPGQRYQLLRSSDPAGPYLLVREIAASASSEERSEELPVGRQFGFFLLRELD